MYFIGEISAEISKKLIERYGEKKLGLAGGAFLALLGIGFFAIFLSLRPKSVGDYYKTQIFVTKFYYHQSQYQSWIILENGDNKYSLEGRLWEKYYTKEFVFENLQTNPIPTVWLDSYNGQSIKGILVNDFYIDPAIGVNYDNYDRKVMFYSGIVFSSLGILIIIYGIRTPKNERRNLSED